MSKAEIYKILQRKKVILDREFEAKDKTKILEAISEYSTRKTELVSEATALSEDLTAHTWWVSTGFTSKGLRGYLFNSSLKLLNRAVEKYASRLGLRVVFSVDVTKASKPFVVECYMNGNLAEYAEFSGGEQAKIDIATAFAMHDLISAKTEFNILIMDEIFEGLDIENIDITFDLIRTKAEGRSVYVITHSQHVDSLNVKYLGVEKVNGTTILT
jgi:DNA repair exonuclease SbcCD ATPase subunit